MSYEKLCDFLAIAMESVFVGETTQLPPTWSKGERLKLFLHFDFLQFFHMEIGEDLPPNSGVFPIGLLIHAFNSEHPQPIFIGL